MELKGRKFDLFVTRHKGLLDWAIQKGLVWDKHLDHARPHDVRGKNCLGVFPLWLAAEAESVTEINLRRLPMELRGKELTAEEVDTLSPRLNTYKVERLEDPS